MTDNELVDRLAAHRTIGGVPRQELEWLAAHGTIRHSEAGALMSSKGEPLDEFYVVLAGHMAIYVERSGVRHKVLQWKAGDVAGLLPYSRIVSPPGDSFAEDATTLLVVHAVARVVIAENPNPDELAAYETLQRVAQVRPDRPAE